MEHRGLLAEGHAHHSLGQRPRSRPPNGSHWLKAINKTVVC